MAIKDLEKGLYSLEWQDLYMAGVFGHIKKSLEAIRDSCINPTYEFIGISSQGLVEILAGMRYIPPVDITLIRGNSGDSSIVTISLEKEKAIQALEFMASSSDISLAKPPVGLIRNMDLEMEIEKNNYARTERISGLVPTSQSKAWGLTRHAYMLMRYANVPENESIQIAAEKYGISRSALGSIGQFN